MVEVIDKEIHVGGLVLNVAEASDLRKELEDAIWKLVFNVS